MNASHVLVSASRRNNLLLNVPHRKVDIETKVRGREDALASTRDACATQKVPL